LGHGIIAKIFNESFGDHVIVDGASSVIEQFRQAHPNFPGTVIESFFERFESSEPFDVIVMGFILEHVDDPDLILRRYRNYLKPNGRLYVAVPNAKSLNRRLGLELGIIDDIYSLNANDRALGHQRQYCLETLRAALERAGFADRKSTRLNSSHVKISYAVFCL